MIPPDLLARAREAFDRHINETNMDYIEALGAYEAVLSAAWPVADGRLREAAAEAARQQYLRQIPTKVDGEHMLDDLERADNIAWAVKEALSPPSAPAADVRIVRTSVTEAGDGQ